MPDVKQQLTAQGLDVSYRSPEQFEALTRADLDRFGKVIRAAGIKIE
jgi:tripartite-type tricarboxylate transporter receptor subunit TctC